MVLRTSMADGPIGGTLDIDYSQLPVSFKDEMKLLCRFNPSG